MLSSIFRRRKQEEEAPRSKRSRLSEAFGPPLTPEEQGANLSDLERDLNARMVCHAGKNQVFIRSMLTGKGTSQPRIALRCPLRKDIGQEPVIFYETIRDLCCSNPAACEAYRNFKNRHVAT